MHCYTLILLPFVQLSLQKCIEIMEVLEVL